MCNGVWRYFYISQYVSYIDNKTNDFCKDCSYQSRGALVAPCNSQVVGVGLVLVCDSVRQPHTVMKGTLEESSLPGWTEEELLCRREGMDQSLDAGPAPANQLNR